MGSFPYAAIPDKMQEDEQTASFMEDARKILAALQILGDGVIWRTGNGTPEGVIVARAGSLFSRLDGPPSLYKKETGTGNTGWIAL